MMLSNGIQAGELWFTFGAVRILYNFDGEIAMLLRPAASPNDGKDLRLAATTSCTPSGPVEILWPRLLTGMKRAEFELSLPIVGDVNVGIPTRVGFSKGPYAEIFPEEQHPLVAVGDGKIVGVGDQDAGAEMLGVNHRHSVRQDRLGLMLFNEPGDPLN